MCAEQLKLISPVALRELTNVLQRIFDEGCIPDVLKSGYKIPIPKAGKDPLEMNNYQGITITPELGKETELILLEKTSEHIGGKNSALLYSSDSQRSEHLHLHHCV